MEIIVVSHARGRTWRLGAGSLLTWIGALVGLLGLCAGMFAAGYALHPTAGLLPDSIAGKWQHELAQQRDELKKTRALAEENTRALARRIATLDAEVVRLDAAGSRMVEIAHIDPSEFSFDKPPPVGGPEVAAPAAIGAPADIVAALDSLDQRLSSREREMKVLEDLLLTSRLQKEVRPSGWPVASGYITSSFGARVDPFTGANAYHPGIDFASAEGSSVLAVASGIVTKAGEEAGYDGYGRVVEINHGNGYVTRYGHNERVLVNVGDRVQKGQVIARMGSTGRSTGPHVHFEVLLNGQVVNPAQYIQAAR